MDSFKYFQLDTLNDFFEVQEDQLITKNAEEPISWKIFKKFLLIPLSKDDWQGIVDLRLFTPITLIKGCKEI